MKRGDLGVAVIGAGRIGTLRARLAAKHPSVGFLAIADIDEAKARALGEIAVGVMRLVQAPQRGNAMEQHVPPVQRVIHECQRRDDA